MRRPAALLFFLLSAGPLRAATFYVAPAGKDSGPGTLARPFATIQRGLDAAAQPGDSVFVREGVYPARDGIFLRRSGAPGKPITLGNYPGEHPVIRFLEADGGRYPRVEIQDPAQGSAAIGWLVIRGLEISGGYDGVKYYNAHDLVLEGNDIHDSLWQGILGVGGTRITISGNTISHNGDFNGARRDPSLRQKLHGIYATGTRYAITRNIISDNLAWGLQAAGYPYDPALHAGPEYAGASQWHIARNTFAFGMNRGGIVVWLPGASGNTIESNIFYENSRLLDAREGQGVDFYHSGGGNVVRNNLFFATAPGGTRPITDTADGASYEQSGNTYDKDPGFRDPAAGDFRPRAAGLSAGALEAAP